MLNLPTEPWTLMIIYLDRKYLAVCLAVIAGFQSHLVTFITFFWVQNPDQMITHWISKIVKIQEARPFPARSGNTRFVSSASPSSEPHFSHGLLLHVSFSEH